MENKGITLLDIVKNLAHHPRTETVSLPSGCSLVPEQYTPLQRSFLDLVEAARHLRQAARCLRFSWLGIRAALRESAIWRTFRPRLRWERSPKEECNASCGTMMSKEPQAQPRLRPAQVPANRASGACADVGNAPQCPQNSPGLR
jgi:hypothetical protein